MAKDTFVIVGAGLTGAGAAATLRKEGFDGRIVLLGEEPDRPYERPSLSKDFLRGETDREELFVHGPTYYDDNAIEFRPGATVTAIEPTSSEIIVAGRERIGYDKLLIATGARPRRLQVPGSDLDGVRTLRTIRDSQAIREEALRASRTVIIGGGWIGAEVAASLRQVGRQVALVIPGALPMERVLGPEVAAVYRDLHDERGVELYANQRVVAFTGNGSVTAAVTADGTRIEGELVVLGVGAEHRTELASAAGMEVNGGLVVDEYLQSETPGVFAAGDVAAAWHPVLQRRLRVEHWDSAKRQGPAAARNMLGLARPYERIPYFYSDQYDVNMEYAGHASEWDRVVFRGDPASRMFIAFFLQADIVMAGLSVNVDKAMSAISRIVASRRPADAGRLADPLTPIEDLEAIVSGSV